MSDGELAGKVALVTGAARNIGRGIARALAAGGAAVAIHARSSHREAEALADEIASGGGAATVVLADVTDPSDVARMIGTVEARFGRLDILVNNASLRSTHRLDALSFAEWRAVLASNLDAAFLCAQAALPLLLRQGGTIVNIGGQVAHTGGVGRAHVAAAKGGLVGLTRALAVELAPAGIRVNCVAPGLIETERAGPPPAVPAGIPAARLGTIAEIAGTVRFLCGPGGAYVTGQTIHVNGGVHLG